MNNTTATHTWPSWVATVERDVEDHTILCSGAARTLRVRDTSSADPTETLALTIRAEQLLTEDGAATEPVLVTMTPDVPVAVRDFTTADARRVAAALVEAADQVERAETRCDGTLNTPTYTLFCDRDAGHPLPHDWVEHPCPEPSPQCFQCTRSEGHPGAHQWIIR